MRCAQLDTNKAAAAALPVWRKQYLHPLLSALLHKLACSADVSLCRLLRTLCIVHLTPLLTSQHRHTHTHSLTHTIHPSLYLQRYHRWSCLLSLRNTTEQIRSTHLVQHHGTYKCHDHLMRHHSTLPVDVALSQRICQGIAFEPYQ